MMKFKNMLKCFSKIEVQEDKTHPCHLSQTILNRLFGRVLEREGVSISCAEHTEKVFSPFTTHFSLPCLPSPDATRHPLPGEGNKVSCAEHTVKHLFSYSPIHLFTFKKVAFTLAEVLITLAIIGVVAAMTIPMLIQKYEKYIMANQFKTAYSILNQALLSAQKDYGEFESWTYYQSDKGAKASSLEFAQKYLVPYLKHVELYQDPNVVGCKDITYKTMNGNTMPCTSVSQFCGNCRLAWSGVTTQLHLSNGMILVVLIRMENRTMAEFAIDTNGLKGPNVWGKDIFRLALLNNGTKYMKLCGGDCSNNKQWILQNQCTMSTPYSCGDVIIIDGWKIKDDYPWK